MSTTSNQQSEPRTVEGLLTSGHTIAMVMTMVDGEHTSRPVTIVEARRNRVSFLVSRAVDWVEAIVAGRAVVHVTVADDGDSTYLSLQGTASVVTDTAERERLWTPVAKAWFTGPDDPDLAVLRFDVTGGTWWDGPSGHVRRGLALLKAAVTGDGSDTGASGPVAPR